jgi:large subunit ribosomal protein L34
MKRTYQPSTLKSKRIHGFLKRLKTISGIKILRKRQQKKRKYLSR